MSLGINFTAQNLLGAGNHQSRHLLAQRFARTRDFLLDLRLGGGFLPAAFIARGDFRLFDQLRCALLGLGDDVPGAASRLANLLIGLLGGDLQRLLAPFGGGKTVGDGFLAGFDGVQQIRPDELDREPDKRDKDERLCE